MKPSDICRDVLGGEKTRQLIDELNSAHVKEILKRGDIQAKPPGSMVSPQKKREFFSQKIVGAVERGDNTIAGMLLERWLLFYRRPMLMRYLDLLEVPHRAGETEHSFMEEVPKDRLHAAATTLTKEFEHKDVLAYVRYLDFQQGSEIFAEFSV